MGVGHALLLRSPRLFRYGGILVHIERLMQRLECKNGTKLPVGTVTLEPATKEWLQLELARIARWEKPMLREGEIRSWVVTDPPMKIAVAVLSDRAGWQCRVLNGVSETPILRDDGTICDKPGYDDETGLYYDPNGCRFPDIPSNPTKADATEALKVLNEPLEDFPFVEGHHRFSALAMILTAMIRRQLPTASGFGVSARAAGTGKGLLVDAVAVIATGRKAPLTQWSEEEEEQAKGITSALPHGHPTIHIDNINAPLKGAAFCTLLTGTNWVARLLGSNTTTDAPTNVLVIVNGNNLVVKGDLTRRIIPIQLDAKTEHPEERKFNRDLLPWIEQNRPKLVAAALTVLSAWRKAGRPVSKGYVPLGSFEDCRIEDRSRRSALARVIHASAAARIVGLVLSAA